jgi:hypothetical protein
LASRSNPALVSDAYASALRRASCSAPQRERSAAHGMMESRAKPESYRMSIAAEEAPHEA